LKKPTPKTEKQPEFTAMSRLAPDIDLDADGKAMGFVRIPHSVHRSAYGWIPLPIVRIKNGKGPTVILQAGNHGDEWEGQIGLGNLIRELKPKNVQGKLIIVPSANFPAAMAGTRTSPIDEGNLNRLFPGDPDGTITQQIAYWIEHHLVKGADYAFDFHSGGSSLSYIPSALAPKHSDPKKMAIITGLLKAFGAPVSYIASAPQGGGRTYTSAAYRQGAISMGTELGGGGLVTPHSLKVAEDGMRRVLAHIGVLKGIKIPAPTPTRLTEIGGDDYYVYASDGGLFEPLVDLGAEVKKGQPAARIHFHHTPWREPEVLRFKRAGLVLCKRVPARCERGDCLFHLATDIAA
jgi:predicted deacylase